MQNLTIELFARDKNARRQLLDDALAVSPTSQTPAVAVPENSQTSEACFEPIPELVQILLAADSTPKKSPPEKKESKDSPEPAVHANQTEEPQEEVELEESTEPEPEELVQGVAECEGEGGAPFDVEPTQEDTDTSQTETVSESESESEPEPEPAHAPEAEPAPEPEPVPQFLPEDQEEEEPLQTSTTANSEETSREDDLTCAQLIAEEERLEREAWNQQISSIDYETPPPLQRVPYDEQPQLANIRAVTESMNIAALPQQPQPMSFAACVRKMPSIETMSLSPSPYAKFDGKSNPFTSGGSSVAGFNRENKGYQSNPFANRKRFEFDYDSNFNTRFSDRTTDRNNNNSESFSSLKRNDQMRNLSRGSESAGLLPSWWKSRSFSSASSHYPQSQRLSCGQFSASSKNMTALNIPTHGHVEDLDGFLSATAPSANTYYNRKSDLNLKKERWARMKAKKRLLRRPVEDEFYEDPDIEEEILGGNGVMLNQIVQQSTSGHYEDADLLRKFRRDVSYVKEHVMNAVDGNIDGIRDLRFLLASVQTYGNIDGECMMAELAMNEFSLFSGIVEKFHSIVGPWQTDNESQRRRASRHAFETHRIPLQHTIATLTKRKLIEEILGRVEPSIACHQGVKVGLYSDNCDEKTRVELNIKNNFKDPGMLCDRNDRRFILVLQSELDLMVESMRHLAKTVGLHYEGFPIHHNRFVIVEAFVEAIADIMGEKIDVETMRWFSLLGQKVEAADTASPWETGTDFHCTRHSEPKSNFCAAVTVGRSCCIIYHVLGSFFRRYHLKKIPTADSTFTTSSPF
uniref:Maelstrom domain-containing protein n=1 Tax=Caenorhabditis japonica TaxID=281687 RepID=A0A8R1DFB1_CAEJA